MEPLTAQQFLSTIPDYGAIYTTGQQRLQQAEMEKQLMQQKIAAQQQQQQAMQSIMDNPNLSSMDILKASMYLDKDHAEALRKNFDGVSKDRQDAALNLAGKVMSAFEIGKPEYASDLLKNKAREFRNSGNEQEAKFYDAMATNAIENPHATQVTIGLLTSHMPGGDKVMEAIGKHGEEARKEELQPGEVTKQKGELAKQQGELVKQQFEIQKQPGELEKQKGELLQQAAQLGLTKAQSNEVMVKTRNLGIEGKKAALELEALKSGGGTIDPNKKFEFEQKLRKEYNDQTGEFQLVKDSYQRILQSQDNPAGDISMIFNYMKMLDPGSVVREKEYATAENAGGVPTRIRNTYNKAISGERLTPEQRKMFTGQAESLYTGATAREKEVRAGIEKVGKSYGLNKSNIFYSEEGTSTPVKQGVVKQDLAAQIPGNVKSNQKIKFLGFE